MEALYKTKFEKITAEQLESDALVKVGEYHEIYLNGGTYLIKNAVTEQLYPISKECFEYLFEKEERNE